MGAITTANVASAIVKLVATAVPEALAGNLVMAGLVHRDYEAALASAGDVINIPLPPVLSANNIAEEGSVTTQNPSPGNAQVVVDRHIEASFQIPDITKVLASPDLLAMYLNPAIYALAEQIETDIFGLYPHFTYNTAVGGSAAITEAVVDSADTTLFTAKIPTYLPRYLAVSGATYGAMRQLERFTEAETIGSGDAIATGEFGKIKGFNVFRSQFVVKTGGVNYGLAFTRPAIALVMRQLPGVIPGTGAVVEYAEYAGYGFRIVMSYAPNTLAQQFTVDCLYGTAVLRNPFCVQVKSNE